MTTQIERMVFQWEYEEEKEEKEEEEKLDFNYSFRMVFNSTFHVT